MKKVSKLRINFYRNSCQSGFAFSVIADNFFHVQQIMMTMSLLPPSMLAYAYVCKEHGINVLQTWKPVNGVWEEK